MEGLSRRELQALAKKAGIKANLTVVLRLDILELLYLKIDVCEISEH